MAMQKFKMFITKSIRSWDEGRISVNDFNMAEEIQGRPVTHILIGEQEIDVDVPDVDTRQIHIDVLNAQISKERAESQSRVNIMLDRISKLTCITHESEAE